MREREEANGDGVAGKEIGLGVQVVIVDGKTDGEARIDEPTYESGLERGKRGRDGASKVVLDLGERKDVVEPSDVVDFSVPARNVGSSTSSERAVQTIGSRPEIVVGWGDRSIQLKRAVHVGLEMRGERGLRSGRFRSVAFSP